MNEARTSYPTTAAKDFVIPKPRLRIFFIWPGDKAGIRLKVASRPFPYVADHLPAAERTSPDSASSVTHPSARQSRFACLTWGIVPHGNVRRFRQAHTIRGWCRAHRHLTLLLLADADWPNGSSIASPVWIMGRRSSSVVHSSKSRRNQRPVFLPVDRVFLFGCSPLPACRSPEFLYSRHFNEMPNSPLLTAVLECKRTISTSAQSLVMKRTFIRATKSELVAGYFCMPVSQLAV